MTRGVGRFWLLTTAAAFVLLTGRAQAGTYQFTSIDEPNQFPGGGFTEAYGINNAGQIVGTYIDGSVVQRGFLLSGGSYSNIDDPSGTTIPYGINNTGQIVGGAGSGASGHGFTLSGGTFTPINVPGAQAGTTNAAAVNDPGQIVGWYQDAANHYHGFVKTGSAFTPIDDPNAAASGHDTIAYGINNAGLIVGDYGDIAAGHSHGFLLNGNTYTTIDDPNALFGDTYVAGINSAGVIVGSYYDGTSDHIFLDNGGVFTDVPDPYSAAGGDVYARGINDAGQIVGIYADTFGDHGFVAAPTVPEPASVLVMLTGVCGVATARRRRRGRPARG